MSGGSKLQQTQDVQVPACCDLLLLLLLLSPPPSNTTTGVP
jgi:hypothetical protein